MITNKQRAETIADFCLIAAEYRDTAIKMVAMELDTACMQARKADVEELRLQLMTQTLIVKVQHRV